jgi:hypothetical protein
VRNLVRGALLSSTIAMLFAALLGVGAQQPGAQPSGGGRGPSAPPQPTPRLADGTPNLGRAARRKGRVERALHHQHGRAHRRGGRQDVRGEASARTSAAGGDAATRRSVAVKGRLAAAGRGGAKSEPQVPFQPWAAAVYNYNSANNSKYDPEGYCLPPGGPRMMATPYPMEIIQLPEQKRIIMIFEGATHIWREIYMDGRPHPQGDDLNPTYLGHSVGRWEGDTLVVDVVGFNEATWMDYFGHPHTDMLHVVEKFSRPNKGTLAYEATYDDPGAYTRPFTLRWTVNWNPSGELTEYICQGEQQVHGAADGRLRPAPFREKAEIN